ncbi:MAG: M55 family metallopeptidase [Promethearchaeota archaeon]
MKAFISIDLEGMPYIVIPGHLSLKGALYTEARQIATKVTLAVAEELHANGAKEVVVADSHGPMVNLLVDNLPDYLEIVRGYPRPVSMVAGVENCDVAMFLGYHARAGTAYATFDHTYSGRAIHRVMVNGVEASEFLLNAYVAGDSKIPVVLVAGDRSLLEEEVKQYAPWAERIVLKQSLGRGAARSFGMGKIEKELRNGVKQALTTFKQKQAKPLITKHPVTMRVTYASTYFADAAELLPIVTRKGGLDIEYTVDNMVQAYKVFELLSLAASGVWAIKQNQ